MFRKLSATHIAFLLLVSIAAIFLNWSAISASSKLYNLIVVVPSGILCLLLALGIILSDLRKASTKPLSPETQHSKRRATFGDLLLLAIFAVFCLSLTRVGFDIATFIFVWIGVLLSGEKNKIIPPIFSLVFTIVLTKGFGSLFPFPMPLLIF